jgi:surface polysaccharide O-acyltransferase-like enzyme
MLEEQEFKKVAWNRCYLMKIITTKLVGFYVSLYTKVNTYGLKNVIRFKEGLYVVKFSNVGDREKVVSMGPWRFK